MLEKWKCDKLWDVFVLVWLLAGWRRFIGGEAIASSSPTPLGHCCWLQLASVCLFFLFFFTACAWILRHCMRYMHKRVCEILHSILIHGYTYTDSLCVFVYHMSVIKDKYFHRRISTNCYFIQSVIGTNTSPPFTPPHPPFLLSLIPFLFPLFPPISLR